MSGNITIDKDVPIPEQSDRRTKYPFADMQVGDSFAVPEKQGRGAFTAAVNWSRRHNNAKFTYRRLSDGTYRIWRVS